MGSRIALSEARQREAVLRVMCLALMMVVAAVAGLNVALPELARDTGATQTQLQWIVDAYAIASRVWEVPLRRPVRLAGALDMSLAKTLHLLSSTDVEI